MNDDHTKENEKNDVVDENTQEVNNQNAEVSEGDADATEGGYMYPVESSVSTVLNSDFRDFRNMCEIGERRLHLNGEIQAIYDSERYCPNGPITAGEMAEYIIEYNACDRNIKRKKDRDPIWLFIDCIGGDVSEGFRLISAIELSKTPVYTVNMGQCSSMAFLIFIAGHKRLSMPYSTFLMHDGFMYADGSTDKVIDQVEFESRQREYLIKPFVLEHSKMTSEKYDIVKGKDFLMTAEDALEYGFTDGIIKNIDVLR